MKDPWGGLFHYRRVREQEKSIIWGELDFFWQNAIFALVALEKGGQNRWTSVIRHSVAHLTERENHGFTSLRC